MDPTATEKHVSKYSDCASYIINETPQLYQVKPIKYVRIFNFFIILQKAYVFSSKGPFK